MKKGIDKSLYPKPFIYNCYKPAGMSSQDIVRKFKRFLPKGYGKIGHFGTLDPFACGVLMIGVAGAARLNDYIHDCLPKTYRAVGVLGIYSDTGDLTEGHQKEDTSEYFKQTISQFDLDFIQELLEKKFLGTYEQSAHHYSAAKYQGRKLHEWARDGVKIDRPKKKRFIHSLRVLSVNFPKLEIEFTVSSGTYIRTLFKDCAEYLGTYGTLEELERTKIGICGLSNSLSMQKWPDRDSQIWPTIENAIEPRDLLPFTRVIFASKEALLFRNGVRLKIDRAQQVIESRSEELDQYFWIEDEKKNLLGLAVIKDGLFQSEIIFNFD